MLGMANGFKSYSVISDDKREWQSKDRKNLEDGIRREPKYFIMSDQQGSYL